MLTVSRIAACRITVHCAVEYLIQTILSPGEEEVNPNQLFYKAKIFTRLVDYHIIFTYDVIINNGVLIYKDTIHWKSKNICI